MKCHVFSLLVLVVSQLAPASDTQSAPRELEDAETRSTIVVTELPAAEDGEAIRHQAAGFVEGCFERPFVPIELGNSTLAGLPTYFMRGVVAESGETFVALGVIAFADDRTHIGWVQGYADLTFDRFAELTVIAGKPHPSGDEIVRDIAERSRAMLPKLKQMAVQKNRQAFLQVQEGVRRRETAIELARRARADLAPDETNAEVLNRRLRSAPPERLYGWAASELSADEYSVTFIYETGAERVMLVWITNTATNTCANVSEDADRIATLKSKDQVNLPSDQRLMPYEPKFDMTTFRNSDYYRGRGTDQLGQSIQ